MLVMYSVIRAITGRKPFHLDYLVFMPYVDSPYDGVRRLITGSQHLINSHTQGEQEIGLNPSPP